MTDKPDIVILSEGPLPNGLGWGYSAWFPPRMVCGEPFDRPAAVINTHCHATEIVRDGALKS